MIHDPTQFILHTKIKSIIQIRIHGYVHKAVARNTIP